MVRIKKIRISVLSWGQTAFGATSYCIGDTPDQPCPPPGVQISSYLYNGITLTNCTTYGEAPGYQSCIVKGALTLNWNISPTNQYDKYSSPPQSGWWGGLDAAINDVVNLGGIDPSLGQGSLVIVNYAEGRNDIPLDFLQSLYDRYNNKVVIGGVYEEYLGLDPAYPSSSPNWAGFYLDGPYAQFRNPPQAPIPSQNTTRDSKQPHTPDPVNIFSGESSFFSTDLSLGSQGPKLALSRKYRSFSTRNTCWNTSFSTGEITPLSYGLFGYGWRTDFDVNLSQDSSGDVIIYDGEGDGIYFMNNSGTYSPSPGNYSILTKNADNTYTVTDKHGKKTHYDINGRLTSVTDRNGNTLTFVYNPAQVGGTYIQDVSGRRIVLNLDTQSRIISAVDPAGRTFQYGYDTNGNLVSVTDPTGVVTNYVYDSSHQITKFTNSNGHNTYYQYDSQGRCVMTWRDNNVNKTTLNYEANNTTVVTDSLGNNNTYVFNDAGLLISHTDPLGNATQQTWDPMMNLLSRTDARNNVTNYVYDGEGNLVQITDPLGKQTNMTYTPDYNLISSKTDALNNITNFVYDIDGNLNTITDALGNKHSLVRDQSGSLITATDTRGNSTNFTYDAFGHMIQKTDALGNKTNFTYE